jgi:hypothetical protein
MPDRLVHSHHVLRRDISQDIVDLLENEATTGAEDLHLFLDVPVSFRAQTP